jgi:hypothetical protein
MGSIHHIKILSFYAFNQYKSFHLTVHPPTYKYFHPTMHKQCTVPTVQLCAVAQWLRHCATNRKVAGSNPDCIIGIFHWNNPSCLTVTLGSTQPLTEIRTRNISWGKGGRCVGLTNLLHSGADCLKIWKLQPPGILWACQEIALPLPLLLLSNYMDPPNWNAPIEFNLILASQFRDIMSINCFFLQIAPSPKKFIKLHFILHLKPEASDSIAIHGITYSN